MIRTECDNGPKKRTNELWEFRVGGRVVSSIKEQLTQGKGLCLGHLTTVCFQLFWEK